MTSGSPDMGKGLFGYKKAAVHQIIVDRDAMLRHAETRIRQAEGKVGVLEAEIDSLNEKSARKDEQIMRLRAQLAEASSGGEELEGRRQQLESEAEARWQQIQQMQAETEGRARQLEQIRAQTEARRRQLGAETERSKQQLQADVERSRKQLEAEALKRRQQLQADADKLAAWRALASTAARAVSQRVSELQSTLDELPDRVQQAFGPMTDSVSSLQRRMAEVAGALSSVPSPVEGTESRDWQADLSEAGRYSHS
jgi:chromosome segregation ATPase